MYLWQCMSTTAYAQPSSRFMHSTVACIHGAKKLEGMFTSEQCSMPWICSWVTCDILSISVTESAQMQSMLQLSVSHMRSTIDKLSRGTMLLHLRSACPVPRLYLPPLSTNQFNQWVSKQRSVMQTVATFRHKCHSKAPVLAMPSNT